MDCKATTLGEICDRVGGIIQTGPFGSQLHQSDYSQDGIPLVMPKDIIEGRIATDSIARVTPEHVERLSRHKLKLGDIVYGRRGDIGRQALIRQPQAGWLCGTGCLRLSLGDSVIEPIFLHYYLREPDVIGWIANQAIGATLPNLNTRILRSVPVRLPPLPTQRKIAAILSAYDDLIENNLRRINIMEEMAQSLYREWFVKFRFPGHQHARFTDSPLGQIPEGCEVRELNEFVDFERGVEPGSKNYTSQLAENHVPFLRVGDLGKRESNLFIEKSFAKGRMLTPDDIAITMDGTVGLVSMGLNGSYSSGIRRIAPKSNCPIGNAFVFQLLQSEHIQAIIESHAKGTTIKHASSSIGHMIFVLPDKAVADAFEEHVEPLNSLALSLGMHNDALSRTRDLLLPRLISGEVAVSELDISVPEEAVT